VAAQGQLDACRRGQQSAQATARALQEKLDASQSALADLRVDTVEAQQGLSSLESELQRSREVAAEEGKKAFACHQQLESRNRQLEESMQRWRVCAKGRGGTGASAEPATTATGPAVAAPPPVSAPAVPSES
jgi:hypothetical protein